MTPVLGHAWVGYVPNRHVVGTSKLARMDEIFARRLQILENLMAQVANMINNVLMRQGVGAVIKASHYCVATRGMHNSGTDLVPTACSAAFATTRSFSKNFST
jgi:GTP cyclohydrolase I